jgi:hypothetical protein
MSDRDDVISTCCDVQLLRTLIMDRLTQYARLEHACILRRSCSGMDRIDHAARAVWRVQLQLSRPHQIDVLG